jgi:hypothetical protein
MNFFTQHIPFEVLVDCAEGKHSTSSKEDVFAHLATCGSCSSQMRKLQSFIELSRNRMTERPPRATTSLCLSLFRPREFPAKQTLIKRLVGSLVFDDWQTAYATSERYANSDSRQLLYRAEDLDVDLRIAPIEGRWSIAGQILGECKGGRVRIESETTLEETSLNEACEFVLPNVSDGRYTLKILLDDVEIEIPNVILQS